MPRNMSFFMTQDQIRQRTKDVTRRFGWSFLKPGDQVWAAEKCQGLKKGEKINKICLLEIVSVRREPLESITESDVIREGFPDLTAAEFVQMLVEHYRVHPSEPVNRIEFKYVS